MQGIRVDPEGGTARAEADVLLGELDRGPRGQRGIPRLGGVPVAGVVTEPANRTDTKRCWVTSSAG